MAASLSSRVCAAAAAAVPVHRRYSSQHNAAQRVGHGGGGQQAVCPAHFDKQQLLIMNKRVPSCNDSSLSPPGRWALMSYDTSEQNERIGGSSSLLLPLLILRPVPAVSVIHLGKGDVFSAMTNKSPEKKAE